MILGTNEKVNLTLRVPFMPPKEPVSLALAGRAIIGGDAVVHPIVPAEDMMQAFAYRHLVPSESLEVAVVRRGRFAGPFRKADRKQEQTSRSKPRKIK
jgi:hypothetical protein